MALFPGCHCKIKKYIMKCNIYIYSDGLLKFEKKQEMLTVPFENIQNRDI